VGQIIESWLEVAHHEDSTRERYEELIRQLLERLYVRLLACR